MGGFEVLTAASGVDGIETARTERPDAILLDWMMPDMDGPATFEALQLDNHTRDIPVLMLTAKVQASDRQRLVDLGVAGVLSKPFEPMQLPDQVADSLGWSS